MTGVFLLSGGDVATYALNGLSRGMLIFLVASGLTLIFGLIGLINFAHGALLTVGGYATVVVVNGTGSYWAGVAVGVVGVAALGLLLERTLLYHLYDEEPLLGFLATFGIGLVIEQLLAAEFGSQTYNVASPFPGSTNLLGVTYPNHRLLVVVVGALVAAVVGGLLRYTRLGMEVHATAVDESTAEILGVDSERVYTVTFVLGVALAALAGGLSGPVTSLYPTVGMSYMLTAFLVVIVGGMGSFKGSFVASLVVGQLLAFGSLVVRPTYVLLGVFLAAMVFIVFRPRGIFGRAEVFE